MAQTKIKAGLFEGVIGNGTDGYFLMSNGDGTMTWASTIINPAISSIAYPGSAAAADPAGGETITVTGTGFKTGATVTVGGTAAPAVSYVSATEITFTTPAKAAGDYDIVITNTDTGSATFINGISYNGIPTWTTAAGSLGTFDSDTTISTITLQATEPDAGTITFSITNGALPTGLSLTGANIDGTTSVETADTLYTFTVTATDDESQATPRTFTITVTKHFINTENFTINTYEGDGASTQTIGGGKIGSAASFNGSSSKIVTSDIGAKTGDISISAWVYFNDVSGTEPVVCRDLTTTTRRLQFRNNGGTINAYWFHSGGLSALDSNTSVVANQWYHIVTTWEDGVANKIYINGSLDATDSSGIGTRSSLEYITIGYLEQGNNFLDGKLDQVRIFDKVLSSSEITTLYGENNASSTKSTTDIFDDGSGVALYEFEGSSKDTGFYPLGQGAIDSGQSAFFGGNNDRVTASDFSSILGTNRAFTISGWFFPSSSSNNLDLITAWSTTGTTAANFVLGRSSSGTWQYRLGHANSNEIKVVLSDSYVTDKWVHVTFTYDGSKSASGVTLYLNGEAATVSTIADNNLTTDTNYPNFAIGYGAWNGDYYNGYADQVRIYSSELTSSEVSNLANETNVPTSTLVAHYKLDGNANDETTNYNGSASGVTYYDPAEFPLNQYNGTATDVGFVGTLFQPDLVWVKSRVGNYWHVLQDSVRGVGGGKSIYPNGPQTEGTYEGDGYISAINTNGFSVSGGASSSLQTNGNGVKYVAWCWKAGGTVSANNNSNGDITSTVSANQDAGFSIVSFTKTNGNAETIGHGLGAIPELIIMKTTGGSGGDWQVYAAPIGNTKRLNLNLSAAESTSSIWNNTTPTDTVFTTTFNPSTTIIAYCFHSVDGYQKVGSYSGNGSTNGPTITTGFRPRFLIVKRVDAANDWLIFDSIRSPSNPLDDFLKANETTAEATNTDKDVDFLINGFQMVNNQAALNASGTNNYIYLAIA